jgi:hypothetical protein
VGSTGVATGRTDLEVEDLRRHPQMTREPRSDHGDALRLAGAPELVQAGPHDIWISLRSTSKCM